MNNATPRLGQRVSLHFQPGTVRYIGAVANKPGSWLGIEWDNPVRGKNDGTHEGVSYFKCRSKSATAASFLRPSQSWDEVRTFVEALTDKYFKVEEAQSEAISISRSKQIEEVGFQKFARRQAELRGIHVLVLARAQIGAFLPPKDHDTIARICTNITDVDLGGNLYEHVDEILQLCSLLPKLKRLTLDGNRFSVAKKPDIVLPGITTISLSNTLLDETTLPECLTSFPNIEELDAADNALTSWHSGLLPHSLRSVNLAHNDIGWLDQIPAVFALPQLQSLVLKDNQVRGIAKDAASQSKLLSSTLVELDVGRNLIEDWEFFDHLLRALPALHSLRVTGNPLYSKLQSADQKALAAEDGYMLTIARLPSVRTLNFSTVREKDRLNAEKYYLSQISVELSRSDPASTSDILAKHPRWTALCEEYGEPDIHHELDEINPKTLAARLVSIRFHLVSGTGTVEWTAEVPRAVNIYGLYGLVGKRLDVLPIRLRLTWQTGERDPVSHKQNYRGPEWWDSSDDDETSHETWAMRDIHLVPGTRAVGTYLEGRTANVRVELLDRIV